MSALIRDVGTQAAQDDRTLAWAGGGAYTAQTGICRHIPGSMRLPIYLLILLIAVATPALPAAAQGSITISDISQTLDFPNTVAFSAHISGSDPITEVILEYGVDRRSCGEVMARAYPEFTPAESVDVEWTWDMERAGSEPPGATIWYRWRAFDADGATAVSEIQRFSWLDDNHPWQQTSRGDITLHWYEGSQAFADDLLNSATNSLADLARTTGVRPQAAIQLYVYASTEDMREAILGEPGWTGGVAFPDYNITIIGISPEIIEWGKSTIAHELTHLLVGQISGSCGSPVPTWLNEGIAVYGEGGLDVWEATALNEALTSGRALGVRALSGGFSAHPDRAGVAYAQSYSLVNYLIQNYGGEPLLQLFAALSQGAEIDAAMQQIYGFGLDGLDERWRVAMGAPARNVTPEPPPAAVPTIGLIAAVPVGPTRIPTAVVAPTSVAAAEPTAAPQAAPPAPARSPVSPSDPRLIGAIIVFLLGAGISGFAGWRLLRSYQSERANQASRISRI